MGQLAHGQRPQSAGQPLSPPNAGVQWPNTWSSFDYVQEVAIRTELGVGFVLTAEDPYTCIDLDHCVAEGGEVSDATRSILSLLSGYVELSPSGSGLHIWIKSDVPINRRTVGIEIYSSQRWISMTGRHNPRVLPEIPERSQELVELVRLHFPGVERENQTLPVGLEEEDVWQRLFRSQNGAFFESLYRGDISVAYNDHSRAVILLANHLARVTDLDAARIKRMLYQTNLVRPKWEERRGNTTWIDHQILNAIRYVARRK
jgi:putative DNA primase/helicase